MNTAPQNLEDYSPSSTIITFDRPVPLLRGPLPAGLPDDPSIGPYVLAFRSPHAWAWAYKACESQVIEQCEGGARIGCAISASSKCKLPWWKVVVGGRSMDLKEREECEEREMEICLVAAKEKCVEFAKDKCLKPFRDARIAIRAGEKRLSRKAAVKLICCASVPERSLWFNLIGLNRLDLLSNCEVGATNYRGSDLLASDEF